MTRVHGSTFLVLTLALGVACGGTSNAAEAPKGEPSGTPPAEEKPAKPGAAYEAPSGDTAAAEPAPAAKEAGGADGAGKDAPKGRDIVYRPTADGLVIEIEGVKLEPLAVPLKMPSGWGLTLSLKATSTDGHMHKLLKSTSGPYMVSAEIDRGGKKERFGDERKGEAEEFVPPGDSVELKQKVEHAIYGNQTLTLQVGLWGLGRDDGERRPVKKLFIVKMVPGAKKPAAVITPPE